MNRRSQTPSKDSSRAAAQEEWLIEFMKNKFCVSYSKVKEAIMHAGNSYSGIAKYLGQ
jgi:hypothetical protein